MVITKSDCYVFALAKCLILYDGKILTTSLKYNNEIVQIHKDAKCDRNVEFLAK